VLSFGLMGASDQFKDAARDQSSFLAPLEKKALVWMAHRMPAWINSDHLTLLGFLGMSLAVCATGWRAGTGWPFWR